VVGGADWIEAGTPMIKSEGMDAVRALREAFPGREIVADMKVTDTGALEVEMAAKAGSTIICILADADDTVIRDAVRAASVYGVRLMADLINSADPIGRAVEVERMGVGIINAHVGIDQQMTGKSSVDLVAELREKCRGEIAVAGGLVPETAAEAVRDGAGIIIVGGYLTHAADVAAATRDLRTAIDQPEVVRSRPHRETDEIHALFSSVSTPNISDAMHRKGAMPGILPVKPGIRMSGPAVTVQTIAGDWAKPVEAIDRAAPGDVIVINNDGGTHIAPWGELATLSCQKKGIAGVVIDGAVRDLDDIRELGYPVFARAAVPNAGEPKGFGEINSEIRCGGQTVRPGDWVIGDESGVVVVPRERAYEVARRAMEVKKNEERIREEIRRGSTLSEVAALIRWEKR
jgi:3-hexulose-6-phosphate synthase/6-phospho-3-hexuloisomerase